MTRTSLAIALACIGIGRAMGADLSFDPRVELTAIYSDNYRLAESTINKIEVTGVRLDARAVLRAETPRSRVQLTPRLRSTLFPGDEEEESNDFFVRLLAERESQRMLGRLDGYYSHVAVRGRYFPDATIGSEDVLGTPDRGAGIGRIALSDREDRLSISPVLQIALSERRSLGLRATYLDVSYDRQVPGDRADFTDLGGSIDLTQALSERSKITFRAGMSTYDPQIGLSRGAYSVDVDWRRSVSESSEIFVRGGMYRAESLSETGDETSWDNGFTGGAGVRWGFQLTDVWLELSQSLDPSSSGSLVSRRQLRAQLRHRLSEVTGFTVGVRYISDSGTESDLEFQPADYAAATVGFDWRIARKWTLVGYYDYRWREYESAPRDARSNSVHLGVVYEPNRR